MAFEVGLEEFLDRARTGRGEIIAAVSVGTERHLRATGSDLLAAVLTERESGAVISAFPGRRAVRYGKDVLVGLDPGDPALAQVRADGAAVLTARWGSPAGVALVPSRADADPRAVGYLALCEAALARRSGLPHPRPVDPDAPVGADAPPYFGMPLTPDLEQAFRAASALRVLEQALRAGERRCVLTDVHGFARGVARFPEVRGCVPELTELLARQRPAEGRTVLGLALECHTIRLEQQRRLEAHLDGVTRELRRLGAEDVLRTGGDGLLAIGRPESLPAEGLARALAAPIAGHLSGAAAAKLTPGASLDAGLAWLHLALLRTKAANKNGEAERAAVSDLAHHADTGPVTVPWGEFRRAGQDIREQARIALRNAVPYPRTVLSERELSELSVVLR